MNVLVAVAVAVAEAVNVPTIVEVEVEALEFLVVAAGVVLSEIKYERSSSFLAKSFLAKRLFCFDFGMRFRRRLFCFDFSLRLPRCSCCCFGYEKETETEGEGKWMTLFRDLNF